VKGVLFDLDGTLIDSALDIADSCNRIAQAHGYNPLPLTNLHPLVGRGSRGMMARITDLEETSETVMQLRLEVLALYAESGYPNTRLFPGLRPLIQALNNSSILWGVVTSKPRRHSLQILGRDEDLASFRILISLDDVSAIKPAPDGLLLALDRLNLKPEDVVFVGDNRVDMLAARRARVPSVGVGYGYCSEEDHPLNFDPDYYAQAPQDLTLLLAGLSNGQIELSGH